MIDLADSKSQRGERCGLFEQFLARARIAIPPRKKNRVAVAAGLGRLFLVVLINASACLTAAAGNQNGQMPAAGDAAAAVTGTAAVSEPEKAKPTPSGSTQQGAPSVSQAGDPCHGADGNGAPAMVVIRPGRFDMGSPETEAGRFSVEGPQHRVTMPRPFAISRCEITVGQFAQFIRETGYQTSAEAGGKGCYVWNPEKRAVQQQPGTHWHNPGFSQGDDHPVVCVSWVDARRYVDWLSQRTGALYRLPTEAEWEYAARADTDTARYYGDNSPCEYANGLGREAQNIAARDWAVAECTDAHVYTAPVGRFTPNLFGLYDMLGNAWEWTLDCWHPDYAEKPPRDGSVWLAENGGACDRRVVRGGSWNNGPQVLRAADRLGSSTGAADGLLGFRVARAL